MQIPRRKFQTALLMGQKVIIRFWWESGLSSASRNHLTAFCRPFVHYTCLKIVFRDSSLYPKQLSLFCLLWLISASAGRIGYITKFCSMIELLHELKTAVFNIEAFRHSIMSLQGKRKTSFFDFYTQQKIESFLAYFMRILHSCVAGLPI